MRKRVTVTYRIPLPVSPGRFCREENAGGAGSMTALNKCGEPGPESLSGKDGPLRVVYLTDLHDKCRPAEAEQLFAAIARCRPECILCGGDMIVSRPGHPVRNVICLLSRLASLCPVYYAPGNHELRIRRWPRSYPDPETGSPCLYRRYRRELEQAGIVFLENDDVRLTRRGLPVRICGLDLPRRYYRRFGGPVLRAGEIRQIFGSPDPAEYTILLAHTPRMMQAYMDWGADLTLCGHYHGGIMRFGSHRGLASPDFRLFPGNAYGLFQEGDRRVIVSAGCGEHTIPLRIHNPREIVCCAIGQQT